jgi:hypothetical protein
MAKVQTRHLNLAAVICIAIFALVTLLVPPLRDDLSPITNTVSDYLVGSYGGLVALSFLFLAAAGLLKARLFTDQKNLQIILYFYAAGIVLAAFTHPGDLLHTLGAWTAFLIIPLTITVVLQQPTNRHRIGLWVWLVLIVASFGLWGAFGTGLGERITIFLELAWLAYLSPKHFSA